MRVWHFDPTSGELTGSSEIALDARQVDETQQQVFAALTDPLLVAFKASSQSAAARAALIRAFEAAQTAAYAALPEGVHLPPNTTLRPPPHFPPGRTLRFVAGAWHRAAVVRRGEEIQSGTPFQPDLPTSCQRARQGTTLQ